MRAALRYLRTEKRGLEIVTGVDQMTNWITAKASKIQKNGKMGHTKGTKPSDGKKDRPAGTGREALTSGDEVERVTGIEPA